MNFLKMKIVEGRIKVDGSAFSFIIYYFGFLYVSGVGIIFAPKRRDNNTHIY